MPASAQVLNQEIIEDLRAILGDGYSEIVDDQVRQGNSYLQTIAAQLAAGNADAVRKTAHSLKSSAGQIGLQGIHDLARDLEKTSAADAQTGKECSAEAKALHAALAGAFPVAVQALRDYLRNNHPA